MIMVPDYDYPLTSTFVNGSFTHRPAFKERIPRGKSEYITYSAEKIESWFGPFKRFGRVVLIALEEVPLNEEDLVIFEDPLNPYDFYRIGIKTGNWNDTQNLYEELKVILEQKPIDTTYRKAEFPHRPAYIRRRGVVYGIFEIKAYKDY